MPGAAGIVLAGGRSARTGSAKAATQWHGSTLLRRTAGLLGRAAGGPVVVVRAAGQDLPGLPPEVEVADDPSAALGPLQGIAAGLAVVRGRAEVAFVCATDLPFLHPAFIGAVLAALGSADVALPVARGFPRPLAAAYRTALAPLTGQLVSAGQLRPASLFAKCVIRRLDEQSLLGSPELAALDPELDSLLNVSTQEELAVARERPEPDIIVELLAPVWGRQPMAAPWPTAVRAATLARAAGAVRIALAEAVTVTLNGERVSADPELPLARGDTVRFTLPATARSSSMA